MVALTNSFLIGAIATARVLLSIHRRDLSYPMVQTDRLTENKQGYLNLSGVPSANGAVYWKVRLASGSFALLRATAIAFTPQFQVASLTIETRVQNGTTLGLVQSLTLTPGGQITSVNDPRSFQFALRLRF